MISIVIRTKNEERWIGSCLDAVFSQTRSDIEVVLVDNLSTDRTVDKARQYDVKIINIEEFTPGAALNRGIEATSGDIVVCLSGHCIPVDKFWLDNLVRDLGNEAVGGVYGRQEPLSFTPDLDKRDLLITFGLDRREQIKDSFFHNANSAFRREVWTKIPFDEQVTNIEDRIWAHAVQQAGFKIVYEPDASVFHHHGIHQNGDRERCERIIRIIESMGAFETRPSDNCIDPCELTTALIIPVREEGMRVISGRPLYEYTIEHARESEYGDHVIVSTDSKEVLAKSLACGVDRCQLRTFEQARFDVILEKILAQSLMELEEEDIIPDVVVMLEPTFPFRDSVLIDRLINMYCKGGFDTVIPAREEFNSCWMENNGAFTRVDTGYIARKFKKPFFTGIKGLCCVCSPSVVREGQIFGNNVGLYKLDDPLAAIEVRTDADAELAEALMSNDGSAVRFAHK